MTQRQILGEMERPERFAAENTEEFPIYFNSCPESLSDRALIPSALSHCLSQAVRAERGACMAAAQHRGCQGLIRSSVYNLQCCRTRGDTASSPGPKVPGAWGAAGEY